MIHHYSKDTFTKEQVQEWAIEEGGVLVEDDLFFNIVFPHRVSDK